VGRKPPRRLKLCIDAAAYLAVRVAIAIVQALPLSTCERLCRVLAAVLYDGLKLRRDVIDENLRLAYPRLSDQQRAEVARGMWRHLLLMAAEIAHAPRKIHETNWRRLVQIPQIERLVEELLSGRPLVVITAHFGNFELAGYLLGLFGFPSHSIARPLDNPLLDRFVNRFRGRTGQQIVPKDGSGDEIARVLRSRGIVGILGDQAAGPKGCWVQFFGRPASTHKAVAVLSLGAEAPLVVSFARRVGGPLEYELELAGVADPAEPGFPYRDVPSLAQWYTDRLERSIAAAPEQYWWVHRRWKGTPPASHSRPTQAA
jgi:KDO2-lipid IV(A) lauroyltransferase